MAKTCRDCKKRSWETGFENGRVFERCKCSVTGLVHEPDHPCGEAEKPRLCEVLGVDVGERFKVRTGIEDELPVFYIDGDGSLCLAKNGNRNIGVFWLILAINHPERIEREPRLTPEELQRCRAFGAKWVSRDESSDLVHLWETKPELQPGGVWLGDTPCAQTWDRFFPTVQPGQLGRVEDEP